MLNFTISIGETEFRSELKKGIDSKLNEIDVDALIESKVASRVDKILKDNLSNEKIDNMARDRISRILTTENIKEYTFGLSGSDILSNLEDKVLLMIKNSKSFKDIIKQIMKDSIS